MTAITKILAGGVGLAALASAAPAAAQYYPNQGYGGYGQGGLGAIIESLLGGNRYRQGVDQRVLVERCIAAVNNRIERQYAGYRTPYGTPYGGAYGSPYGAPYGGNAYGQSGARVLGITDIDRRSRDIRVRGVATAGAHAAAPYGSPYGGQYGSPYGSQYGSPYGGQYGSPYGAQAQGELRFECNVDYQGRIRDIDVERNRSAYRRY